ncbi:MAG: YraN family protein [Kofleriaceae bacterium]
MELTTNAIGASAEGDAIAALTAAGYQVLERNYRCSIGELDVIARDGDTLVFIEVRSRSVDVFGHAAEMVTRRKQRRVARVAQAYLQDRRPAFEACRFDVVARTSGRIDVIKDAWRL